jgi:hypothetical protein
MLFGFSRPRVFRGRLFFGLNVTGFRQFWGVQVA